MGGVRGGEALPERFSTWKIWYCLQVDVRNFIELEGTKLLPDTELLVVWEKKNP